MKRNRIIAVVRINKVSLERLTKMGYIVVFKGSKKWQN